MLKYTFILSFLMLVIGCQKEVQSNPENYLSATENQEFKEKIVKYFEEPPKKVTIEKKWDSVHNEYYSKKAKSADLYHYYKDNDGYIYFAIAKIAPSLKIKKVATIGKLKIENDTITYYEEICRTWKMEAPELKEKTKVLFDKIVNNEEVENYYTKNSQPEFWIEFPDDINYYDTKNRVWKTK
ncbi:hypothetical protein AAGV28_11995 [Flavobacterium sp. FZUC8N2.13]|uniref:Uncharacterized protein n=1 Tax=Flavobacterium zubiriense TaxID=3138075 RepID=A0ABV4TDN4_9FLAO